MENTIKCECSIKWKKEIDMKRGWYLVTTRHGKVIPAFWLGTKWSEKLKDIIVAWYPLSDIEPYKE